MKNNEYNQSIRIKGNPLPLGTTVSKEGVNFAVSLPNEQKCILHIYDMKTKNKLDSYLLTKEDKVGSIFSIFIKCINPNDCVYRYEIKGKEFTDPYAKVIIGREQFGSYHKDREKDIYGAFLSKRDTLKEDNRLNIPYHELIIYKLNVRGFTMDKSSNVKNKGTFKGLSEKIPYLRELGINCVMLMPCYDFEENMVLDNSIHQCKVNVWGYSESNYYFAPKSSYSSNENAEMELKTLIYELHQNGIEMIMDMYFIKGTNHILISDCIRYWVEEYHVDGFKLSGESLPLTLLATDPLLSETKIIGEGFPIEDIYKKEFNPVFKNLAEYNSGYSYDVKQFLRGDEEKVHSFTKRFINNPSKCGVINYITNHDGFTLNDLYSYDVKHNELNQECNRDGTNYNYSINCGVEGITEDENVLRLREKRIKNAFVTLFFSQGTPLLLAGDEFLQSMNGNNNCYCQDNEVYYLDWSLIKRNESMISFVKLLIDLRNEHPILHKREAFLMMDYLSIGIPDVSFHSVKAWIADFAPYNRMLGVMYAGEYSLGKNNATTDDTFYIAFNMHGINHEFDLPNLKKGFRWNVLIDTNEDSVKKKASSHGKNCEVRTEVQTPCSSSVPCCIEDAAWDVRVKDKSITRQFVQERITVKAYSILILKSRREK